MENVQVSVFCLAYNHEKYIRQCIESILMQETNFNFELIIHEDCSTDKTKQIILEYEKKYPDVIVPIYQKSNVYSVNPYEIVHCMYQVAKGKYIAYCEGDDYWIDKYKLQKQFDILESNQDCSICVHKTRVVENDICIRTMPDKDIQLDTGVVEDAFIKEMLWGSVCHCFQTSSYFVRREVEKIRNELISYKSWIYWRTGDKAVLRIAIGLGDYFYLDEEMSCYRIGVNNSATDITRKSDRRQKMQYLADRIYSEFLFDEWSSYKYHDWIIQKNVCNGVALAYRDACLAKEVIKKCNIRYKDVSKYMGKKDRIAYLITMIWPELFDWYRRKKNGY